MKPLVYKKAKRVRHQAPVRMRLHITKGDTVRIAETRPLAKTVRWRVTEIVERAK